MWLFTVGTVPSVPVMLLYVIFNPGNSGFALALLACIVGSIGIIVLTYCCYPDKNISERREVPDFISI